MSQRIRLWIDGVESEPRDEASVREDVVLGRIPNWTLARYEYSSPDSWREIGVLLGEQDRINLLLAGKSPPDRADQWAKRMQVLMGLGAACLAVWWLKLAVQSPIGWSDDRPSSARVHRAAVEFVRNQYPGAREFGSSSESMIERNGSIYRVGLRVDGLNIFGGPVRNQMEVDLRYNGDGFDLVEIRQR